MENVEQQAMLYSREEEECYPPHSLQHAEVALSPSPVSLFPRLKTLVVSYTNALRTLDRPDNILDMVTHRRRIGVPIEHLELREPYFYLSRFIIGRLYEVVADVCLIH
jgi:hypothetical protein